MGKFTGSTVQPGQVDQATKSLIETPVEKKIEKTPQANAFEELLKGETEVDTDAAAGEIIAEADKDPEIEAQREREKVKPLGERFKEAATESPKWRTTAQTDTEVSDTNSGIQNVRARSKKMVDKVKNKEITGGWGIGSTLRTDEGRSIKDIYKTEGQEAGQQALEIKKANSPAIIMQKTGAAQVTPEGRVDIDPNFVATLSAVTENFMMGAQVASEAGAPKETVDDFTGEPTGQLERPEEQYEFSKAQGNKRLGDDIHREYQRIRNEREGRPTDEYTDLSPTEATVLGDMAKELFAETNPDLVRRVEGDVNNPVKFMVTAKGVDVLSKSNEARKRLFPTQNVRPSKVPLPKGEFVGEGKKLTKKRTTKAGDLGDTRLIDKAMENLHSVPNVVDPRRAKILLATALPAMKLAMQGNYSSPWGNMAGIGSEALASFEKAKILSDRKNMKAELEALDKGEPFFPTNYNVRENMDSLVDTLAQNIRALSQERKGTNHLTYAMQSFTGRVHPQQTYFDPTASKIVRFATRNVTPVTIKPGSRTDANIRQMYAMMFIKDASDALPQERLKYLAANQERLYGIGKQIREAVNAQISNEVAEQIAQAIDNNIPLTDPRFPQVPELQLPDNILTYLNKRGEDAFAVLEGLIDFADYVDAHKAGKPHYSYFNAYMDGKTNGIANNGIQLGVKEVAERTGVIRSQDAKTILDDGDIRAALADRIKAVDVEGIAGTIENKGPIYDLLQFFGEKKGAARDLQKETTMQFGYGKELESFEENIEEYIEKFKDNKDFDIAYQRALGEVKSPEELQKIIHKVYMEKLVETLSDDAADARAVMRANATMYALFDKLFSIKGPSGFNINIAGTDFELTPESDITYSFTEEGKATTRTATIGKRKDTSAAARFDSPGQYAYGRSLPAPIQSLDAYAVAKTVTGRSWEKLRQASNGNPYIHTIYDAFKVDANGYDVVLEEANKNWLNKSFDWSYLGETQKSFKRDAEEFWKEINQEDPNKVLDVKDHGGVRMMDHLFTHRGKAIPLTNRIAKTIFQPNLDAQEIYKQAKKTAEGMMQTLIKMGYKPGSGQVTVAQYKWFVNAMQNKIYNMNHKNASIVERTDNKKKQLRKEIDPKKVYQYYSH